MTILKEIFLLENNGRDRNKRIIEMMFHLAKNSKIVHSVPWDQTPWFSPQPSKKYIYYGLEVV